MYKKDNSFYFNSDAVTDVIGQGYDQRDAVERFPLELSHGLNSGAWPGFYLANMGDNDRYWSPNKAAVVGCFWGTIVKFASLAVDCTFGRTAGQYDTSPIWATWDNFGLSDYTPAPVSGTICAGGVLDTDAYAMCIDPTYLYFFIPRGYFLGFDGAINCTVIDYGRYIISKSWSATYGGLYNNYLSPVGPVAKWDSGYRFGSVVGGDLGIPFTAGAANVVCSYLPVMVNESTGYAEFLPPISADSGKAVYQSPILYSSLLPGFAIAGDGLTFAPAACQFHGKRFIPQRSGAGVAPYILIAGI